MSEVLNANPTIRSASDLPSRRREPTKKSKSKRPFGVLSSAIPESAYTPDPFNPSSSSENESSEDEDEVEPIDEQEIYVRQARAWLEIADVDANHLQIELISLSHKPLCAMRYIRQLTALQADDLLLLNQSFESRLYLGRICKSFNPDVNQLTSPFLLTDLIAPIQDPEHPLTLGSLSVVNLPDISLTPTLPPSSLAPASNLPPITTVTVLVTPTITHCSLATVIGLGVRVRLEQALPPRFRVDVRIKEGTHSTAEQVNRQLGDKERVAAALENGTLMGVLRKMLEGC